MRVMAFKFREEIVGKRFLSVRSPGKLKLNKISEWEWRAGVVRAVTHKDTANKDLTVLVEFDDTEWTRREWIRIYDIFQVFLVENTLVWGIREDPFAKEAPSDIIHWPGLTFTPLVDKAGVGNFRLKTVEFLVDHRLEITDLGETKPYREDDPNIVTPAREYPEVRQCVRRWTEYQDGQRILLSTPSVLVGYRVKVYRAEGTTQWYTAVIQSYNEKTLTVTDDTVLEEHNEDPSLIQMNLLGDGVVDSILRGVDVGIGPRRRQCSSIKEKEPLSNSGHYTRTRSQSPSHSPVPTRVTTARVRARQQRNTETTSTTASTNSTTNTTSTTPVHSTVTEQPEKEKSPEKPTPKRSAQKPDRKRKTEEPPAIVEEKKAPSPNKRARAQERANRQQQEPAPNRTQSVDSTAKAEPKEKETKARERSRSRRRQEIEEKEREKERQKEQQKLQQELCKLAEKNKVSKIELKKPVVKLIKQKSPRFDKVKVPETKEKEEKKAKARPEPITRAAKAEIVKEKPIEKPSTPKPEPVQPVEVLKAKEPPVQDLPQKKEDTVQEKTRKGKPKQRAEGKKRKPREKDAKEVKKEESPNVLVEEVAAPSGSEKVCEKPATSAPATAPAAPPVRKEKSPSPVTNTNVIRDEERARAPKVEELPRPEAAPSGGCSSSSSSSSLSSLSSSRDNNEAAASSSRSRTSTPKTLKPEDGEPTMHYKKIHLLDSVKKEKLERDSLSAAINVNRPVTDQIAKLSSVKEKEKEKLQHKEQQLSPWSGKDSNGTSSSGGVSSSTSGGGGGVSTTNHVSISSSTDTATVSSTYERPDMIRTEERPHSREVRSHYDSHMEACMDAARLSESRSSCSDVRLMDERASSVGSRSSDNERRPASRVEELRRSKERNSPASSPLIFDKNEPVKVYRDPELIKKDSEIRQLSTMHHLHSQHGHSIHRVTPVAPPPPPQSGNYPPQVRTPIPTHHSPLQAHPSLAAPPHTGSLLTPLHYSQPHMGTLASINPHMMPHHLVGSQLDSRAATLGSLTQQQQAHLQIHYGQLLQQQQQSLLSTYLPHGNVSPAQLEVLWQRKFPSIPVPPAWMLTQYQDELLRDVSALREREIVIERERIERAERERVERERQDRERKEREKVERERAERERAERERAERERAEREQRERAELERQDRERKEREEQERIENERRERAVILKESAAAVAVDQHFSESLRLAHQKYKINDRAGWGAIGKGIPKYPPSGPAGGGGDQRQGPPPPPPQSLPPQQQQQQQQPQPPPQHFSPHDNKHRDQKDERKIMGDRIKQEQDRAEEQRRHHHEARRREYERKLLIEHQHRDLIYKQQEEKQKLTMQQNQMIKRLQEQHDAQMRLLKNDPNKPHDLKTYPANSPKVSPQQQQQQQQQSSYSQHSAFTKSGQPQQGYGKPSTSVSASASSSSTSSSSSSQEHVKQEPYLSLYGYQPFLHTYISQDKLPVSLSSDSTKIKEEKPNMDQSKGGAVRNHSPPAEKCRKLTTPPPLIRDNKGASSVIVENKTSRNASPHDGHAQMMRSMSPRQQYKYLHGQKHQGGRPQSAGHDPHMNSHGAHHPMDRKMMGDQKPPLQSPLRVASPQQLSQAMMQPLDLKKVPSKQPALSPKSVGDRPSSASSHGSISGHSQSSGSHGPVSQQHPASSHHHVGGAPPTTGAPSRGGFAPTIAQPPVSLSASSPSYSYTLIQQGLIPNPIYSQSSSIHTAKVNDTHQQPPQQQQQHQKHQQQQHHPHQHPHHPQNQHPQSQHPQNQHPQNPHHQNQHPQNPQHQSHHHQNQHPQSQHPQNQHHQNQHPQSHHHQNQHPQSQHPQNPHHQNQHPQNQHPQSHHHQSQHPHQQHQQHPRSSSAPTDPSSSSSGATMVRTSMESQYPMTQGSSASNAIANMANAKRKQQKDAAQRKKVKTEAETKLSSGVSQSVSAPHVTSNSSPYTTAGGTTVPSAPVTRPSSSVSSGFMDSFKSFVENTVQNAFYQDSDLRHQKAKHRSKPSPHHGPQFITSSSSSNSSPPQSSGPVAPPPQQAVTTTTSTSTPFTQTTVTSFSTMAPSGSPPPLFLSQANVAAASTASSGGPRSMVSVSSTEAIMATINRVANGQIDTDSDTLSAPSPPPPIRNNNDAGFSPSKSSKHPNLKKAWLQRHSDEDKKDNRSESSQESNGSSSSKNEKPVKECYVNCSYISPTKEGGSKSPISMLHVPHGNIKELAAAQRDDDSTTSASEGEGQGSDPNNVKRRLKKKRRGSKPKSDTSDRDIPPKKKALVHRKKDKDGKPKTKASSQKDWESGNDYDEDEQEDEEENTMDYSDHEEDEEDDDDQSFTQEDDALRVLQMRPSSFEDNSKLAEAVTGRKRGRKPKEVNAYATTNVASYNKPLVKQSVSKLKKTMEPFLQDGPCSEVTPKLMKCRECKMTPTQRNKTSQPNIFCRFYAFRRLRYSQKGFLTIAGFSEPTDADIDDIELWMPHHPIMEPRWDIEVARYIISNVGDKFCELVEQEKEAIAWAHDSSKIAWKRAVQGVREMCDVCDTTLFNMHWVCHKCGFVVCLDCFKTRSKREQNDADLEFKDEDEEEEDGDRKWLTCSANRQQHEPAKLMLTQIIPSGALWEVGRLIHEVRDKWNINANCPCRAGIVVPKNGLVMSNCVNEVAEKKPLVNGMADEHAKKMNSSPNVNGNLGNYVKDSTFSENAPSPLSLLADVASMDSVKSRSDHKADHKRAMRKVKDKLAAEYAFQDTKALSMTTQSQPLTSISPIGKYKEPPLSPGSIEYDPDRANPANCSTLRELLTKQAGKIKPSSDKKQKLEKASHGENNKKSKSKTISSTLDEIIQSVVEKNLPKDDELSALPLTNSPPMKLVHYVPKNGCSNGSGRETPIPVHTLTETSLMFPDVAHSWLCEGKLLRLLDSKNKHNFKIFQQQWRRGQPVMVSGLDKCLSMEQWHPDKFSKEFGHIQNDLVNTLTNVVIIGHEMSSFWEGFESVKARIRDDDDKPMILKLKDWPTAEDFADLLPTRYQDLMKALPMPEYTHRTGMLNLASRLPDFFVRPDLGPKMYSAYGSSPFPNDGSTNLHLDVSDAVNVMVYVGIPEDDDEFNHREMVMRCIEEAGVDVVQKRRITESKEVPGALWHIYDAQDADKIRDLLNKYAMENGETVEPHHDPIHDQSFFLDIELRERLYREYGVQGYGFVQCLGDAVFIPAGAPHQVQNLNSCIKVAEDFVSPEHLNHCFNLTQEFRYLSDTHSNHEDKLQVKNIIYHAVKDAVSVLNSNDPPPEQ